MNKNLRSLLSFTPQAPAWGICWEELTAALHFLPIQKMKDTQQNPFWHGEGDVWTHTQMVCEAMAQSEKFRQLPTRQQQIVFVACLLHDIGKVLCTRWEDGAWTSPGHTSAGARYARELLWCECGMSGTFELQSFRETVCTLIRYHSLPLHITDQVNPEQRLFKIAAQGELAPDFYLYLLQILVEADARGRIYEHIPDSLETAELCFSLAEDFNILYQPSQFISAAAQWAYFKGRQVWWQQDLYDDTWGEVILMSGLPGTGKDTWIQSHYPDFPVISLDEIRRELNISPKEPQGSVINLARGRAKELLRKKQPFIWNATNVSSSIRQKLLTLFEQYNAATRIVFLETSWDEELRRNRSRQAEVPEAVIRHMLQKLEVPERHEGRYVEWHCL